MFELRPLHPAFLLLLFAFSRFEGLFNYLIPKSPRILYSFPI
jgi:hypothetical protein